MQILRAYWPSIVLYGKWLALTLVALLFGMITDTTYPFLLRQMVNIFAGDESYFSSAYTVLLAIGALMVIGFVCWRTFDYGIVIFEAYVIRDLDQRCFDVLQEQSLRFFQNNFAGSLQKQVSRFVNAFEGLADMFIFHIARDFIQVTIIFVIFFREYTGLAWFFLAWTLFFVAVNIVAARIKYPSDIAESESDSLVGGALADNIGNQGTVKSFAMEHFESLRYTSFIMDNLQKRLRSWLLNIRIIAIQSVLMITVQLGLWLFLIRGWERGELTIGDAIFFQSYIMQLCSNLWAFNQAIRVILQRSSEAQEMTDIMFLTPEILDVPDAKELEVTEGRITFDNVTFSYRKEDWEHNGAVKKFSLDIQPGTSVALVGKSGAGKSTIVGLMQRHLRPQRGVICIDGQPIHGVSQTSLRSHLAIVPQQPELFHRSIRDNVAFGKPGATTEEVIDALRRAHAWDFVSKLSHGLDTLVGERGVMLSGGERQRIALARAILSGRRIIVLDEATSALDGETESHIQLAITELLRDNQHTCIAIAHRLSTIKGSDSIVVMDGGHIVEKGTHDELIKQDGHYKNLWDHHDRRV